ncbi:hypothetical protein DPF84_04655 [Enterobacter hormaechei]|uniref:hypothetical protein n=1 Tax=Enterobacter hormaechei TaxID=158836 RepID=UPI000DBF32C9|nr:hypothetical protein [Enterobacter hormaechei]AWX01081.1 hypothetical protein DPF84_04655 [Enterobacter hormaechei]MCL8147038.1 hypothetical protein [Enterobacter hormaechei]MCM7929603.1 hypothetical protein [Enterobacter hormaechei]MCM7949188.1 hypothetical protein [Enterobacter hormaechei]RAM39842.1 hypothetical protein DOZ52_27005 [Enterobacter hormaechei]
MSSREIFEAWAEKNGHDIYRSGIDGAYYFQSTQWSWDIWQAATSAMEAKCEVLAAENAGLKDFVKTCFHATGDGCDMDGNDIQELGERLGLFGRETYQPALHGYICGHEAGEDTVYVMNKTPATDAFLAEVRAQGIEMAAKSDQFSMWVQQGLRSFAIGVRQGGAV